MFRGGDGAVLLIGVLGLSGRFGMVGGGAYAVMGRLSWGLFRLGI